jgi:hypothetical protein
MPVIPTLLMAVGAACSGAAIAIVVVGLTCFPSGSDIATRLNLIALTLLVVGLGISLLAKPTMRMRR